MAATFRELMIQYSKAQDEIKALKAEIERLNKKQTSGTQSPSTSLEVTKVTWVLSPPTNQNPNIIFFPIYIHYRFRHPTREISRFD